MLLVPVPGGEDLRLEHLVLDVNGTLTYRGELDSSPIDVVAALRDACQCYPWLLLALPSSVPRARLSRRFKPLTS